MKEIEVQVEAFVKALTAKDEEQVGVSAMVLVGGALINLERIADAVEKLQLNYPDLDMSGELESTFDPAMFGGPIDPALKLDDAEWATIRALRAGDIMVVPSGRTREPTADAAFATQSNAGPTQSNADAAQAAELARIAALPVPAAPGPGAVEWKGGPFAPVNGSVFIMRRNGFGDKLLLATDAIWTWAGDDDDICWYAPA